MARLLYLGTHNDLSDCVGVLRAADYEVDIASSVVDAQRLRLRTLGGYDAVVCEPAAFRCNESALQQFLADRRKELAAVVLHTTLSDVERFSGLRRGIHYDRSVHAWCAQSNHDVVAALETLSGKPRAYYRT